MKIAVSLLSTYLYCPRKVFLEKVLRLKEPPRQPLIFGTIRHEALEDATLEEESLVAEINSFLDKEDVIELYQSAYAELLREVIRKYAASLEELDIHPMDAYERAYPTIMHEASERASNLHRCMEKTKLMGRELWNALTPKIRSEVRVESDQLRLVGIIDQVHDYGDALVPIELKTGKTPKQGTWPGHRIQAAAYALLLEEKYQKPISTAIVHYLDTNQKRPIIINPFMKEEIVSLVDEVCELLGNTLLPEFCDSPPKCAACGLRKQCYDRTQMDALVTSLRQKSAIS